MPSRFAARSVRPGSTRVIATTQARAAAETVRTTKSGRMDPSMRRISTGMKPKSAAIEMTPKMRTPDIVRSRISSKYSAFADGDSSISPLIIYSVMGM